MSLILVFHNDGTGTIESDIGNYNVQVFIGDGTPQGSRTISAGRVEGHPRSDGWEVLVQKYLDKLKGEGTSETVRLGRRG